MSFAQILFTIGLPMLVGAILIVPAWLLPRIRVLSGIAGSALGVALGMALVVAFMAEAGVPSLPPGQKWHMLPILACGIVILCPVVAMVDGSGEVGRWLISIASGGIIGWLAVFPGLDLLGQILLGVWVGISFMVISWVSHRRRGVTVALSITLVFAALSILCMQAHFITLTLIAGIVGDIGIAFVTAFIGERQGPSSDRFIGRERRRLHSADSKSGHRMGAPSRWHRLFRWLHSADGPTTSETSTGSTGDWWPAHH